MSNFFISILFLFRKLPSPLTPSLPPPQMHTRKPGYCLDGADETGR